MDLTKNIQTKQRITPKIYAYMIPDYPPNKGWVKIGDTTRDVATRVKEQTGTADVKTEILWEQVARFNNESYFRDYDFHRYLVKHGIKKREGKEWFHFGEGEEMKSREYFKDFSFMDLSDVKSEVTPEDYLLREEQQTAVDMAYDFYLTNDDKENSKFLWNAKPRFGKTLSAYDLARKMDANNVLIITNRPAIANSWLEDYEKFLAEPTDYKFISEANSLKGREGVFSRKDFIAHSANHTEAKQINFVGLQDLKGSKYHGGGYDKLKWVSNIDWDLVIIDEAHEAIDTIISDHAFSNINSAFTLHLSGTPFKAIASGDFGDDQIFNWSYEDEQKAKMNWDDSSEMDNPYEQLPKLNMYTYRMSNMIVDEIKEGAMIDEKSMGYAFDLNEFFSTNKSGTFIHEGDVEKWLDTLTKNKKYPFSTTELRNELKHSLWMLERVDSAKALARLLRKHPVFENYEIIVAAGDGRVDDLEEAIDNSLDVVRSSIKDNDKTITLSVGQLTTGVTVPEWSAVLMLSNMKSAAQYMQTAFRSQNPNEWNETVNGESVRLRKDNAYVFDFAPERTLIMFDEFANNLNPQTSAGGGTSKKREENIKELLNFFPVIGEDEQGEMKELDFNDVITIPKKIKATEVVKRGFMSNFLFANIAGIFSAPQRVLDILDELEPEKEGKIRPTKEKVTTGGVEVDEDGNPKIDKKKVKDQVDTIFSGKVFGGTVELPSNIDSTKTTDIVKSIITSSEDSKETEGHWEEIRKATGMTKKRLEQVQKENQKKNKDDLWQTVTETKESKIRLKDDFEALVSLEKSDVEKERLTQELEEGLAEYDKELEDKVKEVLETNFKGSTVEYFEDEEIEKEKEKKDTVEDDVRARLRGFARTIPSFIMAYGDGDLTLGNFDDYVPNVVFKGVTGITIDQFKFLRDGGPYEEEGETKVFRGGMFDEVVFDESIQGFLDKRYELADYFENHEEDIFDYIPPQETNQIYTPKNVVQLMVDALEDENEGIYDDSTKTFIDIYMKSGLYITEIVKRLYNSDVIKEEFPNDEERIKHILEHQVYGLAPSEIIYQIATNFIFANFDDEISKDNFKSVDVTPDVKEGKLQEKINELFGE